MLKIFKNLNAFLEVFTHFAIFDSQRKNVLLHTSFYWLDANCRSSIHGVFCQICPKQTVWWHSSIHHFMLLWLSRSQNLTPVDTCLLTPDEHLIAKYIWFDKWCQTCCARHFSCTDTIHHLPYAKCNCGWSKIICKFMKYNKMFSFMPLFCSC